MRHFPAINWLISYSMYLEKVEARWREVVDPSFAALRARAMVLLQREAELEEIVRLIGVEALSPSERLVMEGARSIREDFMQQNAYDENDTFTSLKKQFRLLRLVMLFHAEAQKALDAGADIADILASPTRERIAVAKFVKEEDLAALSRLERAVEKGMEDLVQAKAAELRGPGGEERAV